MSYAHLGIAAVSAIRVNDRWVYCDPEGIWRRTSLGELADLGRRIASGECPAAAYAAWRAAGNAVESLAGPPADDLTA